MSSLGNRTILKIDLPAIVENINRYREASCNRMMMAIVKADGYGVGNVELSLYIERLVDYFGVATVSEGITLRRAGVAIPILILGYASTDEFSDILFYNLTATVYSTEFAVALNRAGLGRKIDVHVAIDTGMSRLGFKFDDFSAIREVFYMEGLSVSGIFTHYSCAGSDEDFTELQRERFDTCLKYLKSIGCDYGVTHASNSDGILCFNDRLDMVRLGIGMYGVADGMKIALKNPFTLQAEIVQIKTVDKGDNVGYNGAFIADKPLKIAVVSIGYADGYPTYASNMAKTKVHGKIVNVIGRVCMDYTMIDVTDVPFVKPGDEVIIFDDELSFGYWRNELKAFPYEFLCNLGKRVKRVFIEN